MWLVGAATAFSLLGDQTLYSTLPVFFEELGLRPVAVGIILKELATPLSWVGTGIVRLLQMTVHPYVFVSLAVGLGRVSPGARCGAGSPAGYAHRTRRERRYSTHPRTSRSTDQRGPRRPASRPWIQ